MAALRLPLGSSAPSLRAGAVLIALVLVGCGGDDGAERLDDDAFCARVATLEAASSGEAPDAVDVSELRKLAEQAPNDELRAAIETLVPVIERFTELDENDPEALGLVFELLVDPAFQEATETVEAYATGTCGLPPSGTDDGSVDETVGEPTGSAADDLAAGELQDQLRAVVDELAPDHQGTSMLITLAPEQDATLVALDVTGPSSIDAIGLCEALGAAVDAGTTDRAVVVEVREDGELVASRPPGGACTAA
jgi:hypothetical protein